MDLSTISDKLLKSLTFRSDNKAKVFGIGNNKTGTTSLKKAMINLGYKVGDQRQAENLLKNWSRRDFKALINYCHSANFFQDIPFSKEYTYIVLDQWFPKSKFILTIRDSPEQWYNSLIRFHSKKWGENGELPTKKELENAEYIYKGWAWDFMKYSFDTPLSEIYQKDILISSYIKHNKSVIDYFRFRKEDLLVLNVSRPNAYGELCDFLGEKRASETFPWENKTNI